MVILALLRVFQTQMLQNGLKTCGIFRMGYNKKIEQLYKLLYSMQQCGCIKKTQVVKQR